MATEECYSVVKYVSNPEHAKALRIDPTRVAVGGDSAGGNLAISTTRNIILTMQKKKKRERQEGRN